MWLSEAECLTRLWGGRCQRGLICVGGFVCAVRRKEEKKKMWPCTLKPLQRAWYGPSSGIWGVAKEWQWQHLFWSMRQQWKLTSLFPKGGILFLEEDSREPSHTLLWIFDNVGPVAFKSGCGFSFSCQESSGSFRKDYPDTLSTDMDFFQWPQKDGHDSNSQKLDS